jgi:hypothetical protein
MERITISIPLLLLAALTACGSDALLGPDAPQGIEGTVLIGPQCPVVSVEDPCPDLPYEATIAVRVRDGGLVTSVRSDAEGRFRIGLKPGAYTLVPESGDPFPTASPMDVDVLEGAWTEVTVSFDTGIR